MKNFLPYLKSLKNKKRVGSWELGVGKGKGKERGEKSGRREKGKGKEGGEKSGRRKEKGKRGEREKGREREASEEILLKE